MRIMNFMIDIARKTLEGLSLYEYKQMEARKQKNAKNIDLKSSNEKVSQMSFDGFARIFTRSKGNNIFGSG